MLFESSRFYGFFRSSWVVCKYSMIVLLGMFSFWRYEASSPGPNEGSRVCSFELYSVWRRLTIYWPWSSEWLFVRRYYLGQYSVNIFFRSVTDFAWCYSSLCGAEFSQPWRCLFTAWFRFQEQKRFKGSLRSCNLEYSEEKVWWPSFCRGVRNKPVNPRLEWHQCTLSMSW